MASSKTKVVCSNWKLIYLANNGIRERFFFFLLCREPYVRFKPKFACLVKNFALYSDWRQLARSFGIFSFAGWPGPPLSGGRNLKFGREKRVK